MVKPTRFRGERPIDGRLLSCSLKSAFSAIFRTNMCDEAVVTDIRIRQLAIAQNRRTGIYDSKLFSRVMHPLMQVKIPLLASLFGLLLVSAIPSYAQTVSAQTNTVEAWKKKIVIQLVSKREFPPGAKGQGGTAKVKFVIDRQGKLISRELVESTGSELLDGAALRMVERAEPFPEPPAEVRDDGLTFTVPVIFAASKQAPWAGGQWPEDWVEEQDKVNAKIHDICRGC